MFFKKWAICQNGYASKTRIDVLFWEPVSMPQSLFVPTVNRCEFLGFANLGLNVTMKN